MNGRIKLKQMSLFYAKLATIIIESVSLSSIDNMLLKSITKSRAANLNNSKLIQHYTLKKMLIHLFLLKEKLNTD